MKPEIKKKWIKALESDKYKQGYRALKKDEGFCCLGVLCDLHREETKSSDWKSLELRNLQYEYLFERGHLPKAVMEWAGLDSSNPIVFAKDHKCMMPANDFRNDGIIERPISEFNDNGYTFKDIAKIIKENELL